MVCIPECSIGKPCQSNYVVSTELTRQELVAHLNLCTLYQCGKQSIEEPRRKDGHDWMVFGDGRAVDGRGSTYREDQLHFESRVPYRDVYG